MREWWNGLHSRLKICRPKGHTGSSPVSRTMKEHMISSSPDRYTFQKEKYVERCREEGRDLDDPNVQALIRLYDDARDQADQHAQDPEWQKHNLEFDLRVTDWMVAKVRDSRVYAQNLYAALCNNEFQKQEVWPILKDQTWSCSWRYAGGIVADMQGQGDYIDWYCSGIRDTTPMEQSEWSMLTPEQQIFHLESLAYVGESTVTDDVREDLALLGWSVCQDVDSSCT